MAEQLLEIKDLHAGVEDKEILKGLPLSFQTPEEIPGITVENMLRTAKQVITGEKVKLLPFRKELKATMQELKMNPEYAQRYLNVGFSGGEKKRTEILQLLMLDPKLALLDETDSGLDVDAVQIVSEGVAKFHNKDNSCFFIYALTSCASTMIPLLLG